MYTTNSHKIGKTSLSSVKKLSFLVETKANVRNLPHSRFLATGKYRLKKVRYF